MIWSTHFESLRLLHVDLFLQSAIEIGMGDVHRAKLKVFQSSQGEDNVNGGIANCGSEGLLEIKTRTLRIGHKVHYYIKWKGFPMSDSMWEPPEHLSNAQDLITNYYHLHPMANRAPKDI